MTDGRLWFMCCLLRRSRYWLACGISPWLNECPEQNMLETNAVTLDVGLPPWMTDSRLWFMFLLEIGTWLLKTKWKRETHVELSYVDRNDWMQAYLTESFSCYCSSTVNDGMPRTVDVPVARDVLAFVCVPNKQRDERIKHWCEISRYLGWIWLDGACLLRRNDWKTRTPHFFHIASDCFLTLLLYEHWW